MQEILANAVTVSNGRPVTTSLKVAEVFGKQHKEILRTIRELDIPEDWRERNFALSFYQQSIPNGAEKDCPMYRITRDGFTLLAMGFTGKAAMQFKIAYIEAFNTMERELRELSAPVAAVSVPAPKTRRHSRMKIADAVDMLNRVSFRIQRLAAVLCPNTPFAVPSSPEEVADFCRFAGLTNVNPVRFFNYYESRRWHIDGIAIADWQAVARSWNYNSAEWRALSGAETVVEGR